MIYPKILVFTFKDFFTDNSSENFTVRSFIGEWHKENIYQVLCEDFNSGKTGVVNPNMYRLGHEDVLVGSWLFKGQREVKTVMRAQHTKQSNKTSVVRDIKSNLRQLAVTLYGFLPYKKKKELNRIINDFHPDLIYCNASSPRMYKLCEYYSKTLKIPFFPHVMDDWPNVLCTGTKLAMPINKWYNKHLKNLFSKSPAVFCISEYMCEEYRSRYKCTNFVPLMHSVNEKHQDFLEKSENEIKKIIYAGSLYLERNDTIMQLAEALSTLKVNGYSIEIYAPREQWEELKGKFSRFPIIEYGGFVNQEELEKRISKAWGLTLVESLDAEMLDYTKFSMSTKVPEYLASGKPILAIGHGLQGSIKYIKDNKAGYVATTADELSSVVSDFISLRDFEQIKENAQILFIKNHKKETQQQKFYNIVTKL